MTANSAGGGELDLRDDAGVSTINLHGGQTGNTSVEFPTDAIYDDEILDEPGVANQVRSSFFFTPTGPDEKMDSVDITIPTSGYVEVTAGCYLNLWHINGTTTRINIGIAKNGLISFTDPGAVESSMPSSAPTGIYQIPCTSTRLYSESAGTHRYYFNVDKLAGADPSMNIAQIYIRAKFYPTAYGAIVLSKSDNNPSLAVATDMPGDGIQQVENPYLLVHTLEEIKAKLEAEMDLLRIENERLRFEKEQLRETQQKVSAATSNRNQK